METKGYKQLLAEAEAVIDTISVGDAFALMEDNSVTFVDVRDPRELAREGKIPGAFHCPRGMLEFWIDAESPYHKPVFAGGEHIIFYCASGWRSALAARTAIEMGLANASHLGGGLEAWKKAGGKVEDLAKAIEHKD